MTIVSTFSGVVLLGDSNKNIYFVNSAGTVNTGALQIGNLTSSPAYDGGVAYFGEGTSSASSYLHAFQARNATDYWGPQGIFVNGSVDASPVISQDLVLYVAASNGALYAFDIQDPANPGQLWTLPVFTQPATVVGLLLSEDESQLYLIAGGTGGAGGGIYGVALQGRATPAKLLWAASTSVAFTQGLLNDQDIVASAGATLYGFDVTAASGGALAVKWQYAAGQTLYAPMNLDCVHALVGDASGTFHVVKMSSGVLVGTFRPGLSASAIQHSALYDGQSLISVVSPGTIGQTVIRVTGHFGVIYDSGWQTPISGASFSSAPFIADLNVYAASDQGTLYSLDIATGSLTGQQALQGTPTAPFGPAQLVPYVTASTGAVALLLDGFNYFTTMKNLLLAAKNGSLSSGANPPSPPTFENLVTAVGAAGNKAYVLMWDTSTVNYVMEQGDLIGGMSMLVSEQIRMDKLVNMKTACNLEYEANVSVYLEPYPTLQTGAFWTDVYAKGKLGVLSQHQKMAVFCINGTKLALVSGMNIGPSDYDTSAHPMDGVDSAGKNTYNGRHDTAVVLQGSVVNAIEAEFDRRWAKSGGSSANPGTTTYVKIAGWAIHHDMCLDNPNVCSCGGTPTSFQNPSLTTPAVPIDVLITNSDYPDGPVRQIQKEMVKRIGASQSYIYIENFTLHDIAIMEALVTKLADATSSCKVIVMLPHPPVGEAVQEPMIRCAYAILLLAVGDWTALTYTSYVPVVEDINGMTIVVEQNQGPVTIQKSDISNVQFAFGKSVWDTRVSYQQGGTTYSFQLRYLNSLTAVTASASSRLFYCAPARYFSTVQSNNSAGKMTGWSANYRGIYIHSKLALFDDTAAIIGSGNFNGRSMMYDGEMSVIVDDAATVTAIRSALFTHWGMQSSSTWLPSDWYPAMNAFATSPAAGAIGALPLAFSVLASDWPRKIMKAAFNVFDIDPGGVL